MAQPRLAPHGAGRRAAIGWRRVATEFQQCPPPPSSSSTKPTPPCRKSPARRRRRWSPTAPYWSTCATAPSCAQTGKAAGALHIPRGSLEFKADLTAPSADKSFAHDKPVILHCASGGRAALAGKLLKDMGYQKVFNLGGFKDWVEAGGKVEK